MIKIFFLIIYVENYIMYNYCGMDFMQNISEKKISIFRFV